MLKRVFVFIGLVLVCGYLNEVTATHIRAGELTVTRVAESTYRIQLTVYRDTEGVDFKFGTLDLGDGTVIENFTDEDNDFEVSELTEIVGEKLQRRIYRVTHEYIGTVNDNIKISFIEENRNAGILNINSSVSTPFFIETEFSINGLAGNNSSPVLTIPPVDKGVTGAIYLHSPGAFDNDGDSLSYELVVPLQGRVENVSSPVAGFRTPNQPEFYTAENGLDFSRGNSAGDGAPVFSLDSITGLLTWDAPGKPGEYNVAFRVYEFRKIGGEFFQIGYVLRDMQITIEESDNNPPVIEEIDPICVDAGEEVEVTIRAADPDGDDILIELFGEPFEIDFPAIEPDITYRPSEVTYDFSWQTVDFHAREAIYEVFVKAQDSTSTRLVDIKSFDIEVAALAPENVEVDLVDGVKAQLKWDRYTRKTNYQMQIWRRIGDFDFTPEDCETGIPQGGNYTRIDTGLLSMNDSTFLDETVPAGNKFCYRLVVAYDDDPPLGRGLSYASEEVCVETDLIAPLLLNVDIDKDTLTRVGDAFELEDNNKVLIKWVSPLDLDTTIFQKPYTYLLYNTSNREMPLFDTPSPDTTYVDENVNVLVEQPNYFVEVYDRNNVRISESEPASSVRLNIGQSELNSRLNIKASVPWSLQGQNHLIYRNRVDSTNADLFVLIDSVEGLTYIDTSSQVVGTEYCYYVETRGAYSDTVLESPLINRSQIACGFISNEVNSCKPILEPFSDCKTQLSNLPCQPNRYITRVNWNIESNDDNNCIDIKDFIILHSPTCNDVYDTIAILPGALSSYDNEAIDGLNGCYQVISRNFIDVENPSEVVVKDGTGCANITFPNIFTPNGNGSNDVYNPFNDVDYINIDRAECPRFVKSLIFNVYDRTGNQVFEFKSPEGNPFLNQESLLMNWDGTNRNGASLPEGVYFYGATTRFYNFGQPDIEKKEQGWIKLSR